LSSVGVEGSLSPEKEDARGIERTLASDGVVSISYSQSDRKTAVSSGYLLVNNSNAPFALASMSLKLITGSSNLSIQLSANTSAVSH
jgi:hypothetical protein